MTALRASDGSSPPQFKIPGPPVPGEWQAKASCPIMKGVAVGVGFQWQNVTPFGIPSAGDFLLAPPPVLASNRYTKTYDEVMTVGSLNSTQRLPDRANVALFYAASSPTQVFNQAAEQVAMQQGRSLSQNAHALALINMAMNDSLVHHSSTSTTTTSGALKRQSMRVTRTATHIPLVIRTGLHSS
jgi:hypothetical protein